MIVVDLVFQQQVILKSEVLKSFIGESFSSSKAPHQQLLVIDHLCEYRWNWWEIDDQGLFLSQNSSRFQLPVGHLISFTIIKVENDDQEIFSLFFLREPCRHFWGVADVLWGVGRVWG